LHVTSRQPVCSSDIFWVKISLCGHTLRMRKAETCRQHYCNVRAGTSCSGFFRLYN
jgi:hypothetical protein